MDREASPNIGRHCESAARRSRRQPHLNGGDEPADLKPTGLHIALSHCKRTALLRAVWVARPPARLPS